jgi:hypothetical protein
VWAEDVGWFLEGAHWSRRKELHGERQERLKHEVKFYRRVEMGCYGNEPNIHPGGGEGHKKGEKRRKRK